MSEPKIHGASIRDEDAAGADPNDPFGEILKIPAQQIPYFVVDQISFRIEAIGAKCYDMQSWFDHYDSAGLSQGFQ